MADLACSVGVVAGGSSRFELLSSRDVRHEGRKLRISDSRYSAVNPSYVVVGPGGR
jgi:hypothetical protein